VPISSTGGISHTIKSGPDLCVLCWKSGGGINPHRVRPAVHFEVTIVSVTAGLLIERSPRSWRYVNVARLSYEYPRKEFRPFKILCGPHGHAYSILLSRAFKIAHRVRMLCRSFLAVILWGQNIVGMQYRWENGHGISPLTQIHITHKLAVDFIDVQLGNPGSGIPLLLSARRRGMASHRAKSRDGEMG
jgi:hypothetical protein